MKASRVSTRASGKLRSTRQPKLNGEFVVFGLMADLERLVREHLGRGFLRDSWPILQAVMSAHLLHRELYLGDLLLSIDQATETSLQCIERLTDEGLLTIEGGSWGDGRALVRLSAAGARAVETLAEGILGALGQARLRAGISQIPSSH